MSASSIVVHRSAETLAEAVAGRLITRLVDAQSSGRTARLVLTGGSVAARIHRAVAASSARSAVDWGAVEIWWGDERFVPADDPDRNDVQARADLLDALPLAAENVHPMPTPEQSGGDPDLAAERYAEELAAAAAPGDHGGVPTFDVLMLGVGPDGHVASLFPGRPALYDERAVVGVRGSPKPPPTRISLTLPTLQRAHDVWLVVSGEKKARAVRLALGGAGVVQIPAAGPRGIQSTVWMLDREAAAQLPPDLARISSP
jgi:6-phosphogluconolactonase